MIYRMIYFIGIIGMGSLYGGAIIILMGYFRWLGITASLILYLWMPNINQLADKSHYTLADELDNSNPLFARGFMRKNASGKIFLADLRGLYYCQMASVPAFVCALLYMGYSFLHNFQCIFWMEDILAIYFGCLFLVWLGLRGYYCYCYVRDFRYVENQDGIWKPFSYIAKTPNWGFYRPFHCRYQVPYQEMRERLMERCEGRGYVFPEQYPMEEEQEAILFTRVGEQENIIFEWIHLKEYSDEYMEKLNEIFADYWGKHIKNTYEKKPAGIIFLLCIDEYNRLLGKRLLSVLSVDQGKGRYRLPAVIAYSEHCSLNILANYRDDHGKKMYRRMRKELL